ncbi:MAG: RDD family protein [Planctomycetota bacterium]
MSSENPFASPQADGSVPLVGSTPGTAELASRLSRLGASILDGIVMVVLMLPVQYFLFGDMWAAMFSADGMTVEQQQLAIEQAQPGLTITLIATAIGVLGYLAVNGYWLAKDGQSIGKKAAGIKIVRSDRSQATFGRIVGYRYLPVALVPLVPIVGNFAVLIDSLLIFRGTRKCLHDDIADTIVVKA